MKTKLKDDERTKTTIYSRVMGYFQPTHLWNTGKKGEWSERSSKFFKEPDGEMLSKTRIPKELKKL